MELEKFRHVIPMTVRFGDIDAMGHLNNAKYLTYIEQARILYMQDVILGGLNDWKQIGIILAKVTMDFLKPVNFQDNISIYTRIIRLGNKSFEFESPIIRQELDGTFAVMANATATVVAFDYETQQTIAIPNMWREKIHAYEPAL